MGDDASRERGRCDLTPRGVVVGLCVLVIAFLMANAFFRDAEHRAWCECFGHSQGR